MREHAADAAAPQDVALGAQHREVGGLDPRRLVIAGLHVDRAEGELAGLAGGAAAGDERNHARLIEADAAAEEQVRRVAGAGAESGAGAAGKRERAEAFEEEVALLREEQVEARQVDLLLVDFDLREVGVDGEVGGDVLRDAVLHVAADAAVAIVVDARRHGVVGRDAGERVRLELEVAAARRHLQALQVAGRATLSASRGTSSARAAPARGTTTRSSSARRGAG